MQLVELPAQLGDLDLERELPLPLALLLLAPVVDQLELDLLDAVGADLDTKAFLAGEVTPVFFGSALTNFGVGMLLDAVVDLVPAPTPREGADGAPRPLDAPFAGFVFKVQANMDPSHRDRLAFARICSGHFERGMTVECDRTGRELTTKYATTAFGAEPSTRSSRVPTGSVTIRLDSTSCATWRSATSRSASRFSTLKKLLRAASTRSIG